MQKEPGAPSVQRADRLHLNGGIVFFFASVLAMIVVVHLHLEARFDFGIFYYAAHMILDGARHSLYDISAQHIFQIQYHRPPDTLFRNPPVALIPILPLAYLPMPLAFTVWTVFCFATLFIGLKILESETGVFYGNWPVLLSLAFAPILSSFLHGQFSVVVFCAYAATYALWRRGHSALGGAILTVAGIKFQLVIGILAVLLIKRKGRELAGFAAGSVVLLAVSAWMVGIPSLWSYPNFVLHSDMPLSELSHMANWQGLLSVLKVNYPATLIPVSLVTVFWAAHVWKDLDRGFAAATLAAMLVSFHLTPQDLSLAIVPFYLCIRAGVIPHRRVQLFALLAILITMALVVLSVPLAFLGVPLVFALWWIGTSTPVAPGKLVADHSISGSAS